MSDEADKDSKTEEPSEKKLRDAAEKGNLPFSKEAPAFASLLAALTFTAFMAPDSAMRLGAFLSTFLERPDAWRLDNQFDAIALYRLVFIEIARALAAVMALLILAGVAGSILQNAPRAALQRVKPKLSNISLKKGWSRLFGQKGLVEFAKSVGKLSFATLCVAFAMREADAALLSGMITHSSVFGFVIRDLAMQMLTAVVLVMALIASADLVWSRYHWHQDQRMTRQEVKDEHKQAEGDPIVKGRLRSLQRDRARRRMMAAVPSATLVIANPTHFAIALRYERDQDAAPVVVAKGVDMVALKIREIAEANGVPVFEEVALARSMYKQVSVDSMIPRQFYQAVAELVRIVYANRKPAARGGMA